MQSPILCVWRLKQWERDSFIFFYLVLESRLSWRSRKIKERKAFQRHVLKYLTRNVDLYCHIFPSDEISRRPAYLGSLLNEIIIAKHGETNLVVIVICFPFLASTVYTNAIWHICKANILVKKKANRVMKSLWLCLDDVSTGSHGSPR